ncbi:uncharacterized protein LOC111676591 isoform X1 [Lucilia cuprina]|uniref:uncharacterized protein LOC111676591 isoform X1 n=1 Tax=Lucilia cuprina TaxID=7375 RepID=UPI001F05F80D|nr:uncharacterized protein LOC111676591 isoform X1 [Lucilia cuprina]
MKFIVSIMLLIAAGTAIASTHVNVSFSQHSSSGSTELRNDHVQLKPSDSFEQFNNNDQNGRFARIQVDDKTAKVNIKSNPEEVSNAKANHESTADYRSEHAQNEGASGYFRAQEHNQQRGFYISNHANSNGQFRNVSPQDKQNMEFERYIQNYHSGPTVETVYESGKPEMQHTLSTSGDHEGKQRVSKFERLVAPSTKPESVQSASDDIKPIVNHQPVTSSHTASVSSSSSSTSPSLSPSVPSVAVSSTNGNSFKVNLNQKPSLVGKDGFNFDLSYNKPNYNDPNFKYNEGNSDAHFYNQFPPTVEEPQGSYGQYYGNIYNRQQVSDGYNPVEQRPVVTKTIQIAQPAIKAKKYEVRHPAIQKEFYDIEERVVIKPAGTVVVELERPSAKILKEETTLPLGHPHPAVASAYTSNRNTPTFSNIIYSNAGSSSNHPNNQYTPQQNYNNDNMPDHHLSSGSTVQSSPTYDQNSKDVISESKQNKPYNSDNRFPAPTTAALPKPHNREIVVVTDGHGNQRQMTTDQFTYSRDETDQAPSRPAYNHRSSFAYDNGRTSGQSNISPQRSGFQANLDNRNGFTFDAEYINNSGNTNLRNENKPARLQEASARVIEQKQQQQPIIKHEHKIVLSPSQHNIYLSRNQEVPQTKFIEETAQVREIKPHLQKHRPGVMYATANHAPEVKYVQRSEYQPQSRASSQVVQHRNLAQINLSGGPVNRVQYSAPYAQMRLNSDEEHYNNQHEHKDQTHTQKVVAYEKKSEKLVAGDKSIKDEKKTSMENVMEKDAPQAHIEIKIPHSSHDSNKAIVVNSKIRPMMMDDDSDQIHHSKLEISVANKGESQKHYQQQTSKNEVDSSDQKDIDDNKNDSDIDSEHLSNLRTKPDCDQSSKTDEKGNYEVSSDYNNSKQQKFMRIVEGSNSASTQASNEASSSIESEAVKPNSQSQHQNVEENTKSTVGHVSPPGSRVIAATPPLKESTPSESFHKRRIVVNHPFQTVREVVEHEPYTNYHEVQVSEPATPALYHSANYYQPHGSFRQSENGHSTYYH